MILTRVREQRSARGWSQERLARMTGLSRAAVSAIETGRIVPSVSAALALADAFECKVEDLFAASESPQRVAPEWAWMPARDPCPFWRASVGGRVVLYPFERTSAGFIPADGISRGGRLQWHGSSEPLSTIVVAGCDVAAALLSAEMEHAASTRVLSFVRSSGRALELLRRGVVHVAGVHLEESGRRFGNARAVRELLGPGYTLLRVASWQDGIALSPGLGLDSIRRVVRAKIRWVGREEGSGARRCLDAILGDQASRRRPEGYDRLAFDHTAVVDTIRTGWAQAGICVQFAAEYGGLEFLSVREEDYDLCCRTEMEEDPRVQALLRVLRSRRYRQALGELPGYDVSATGALERVQ